MKPTFEKKTFVRDWIVRTAPNKDEVAARVGQAEEVWEVLNTLGYGDPEPLPTSLPEPKAVAGTANVPTAPPAPSKPAGFTAAHELYKPQKERPEPSRQQLLQEEIHWMAMHKRRPYDEQILTVLNDVLVKLGKAEIHMEEPAHELDE